MRADHPLNTFVIRFWRRGAEAGSGWVGKIHHVQSEQSSVFIDFEAMQDFIHEFGVVFVEHDYSGCLENILEAMDKATMFVAGVSFEQFEGDPKTKYAVIRALEIVSEATKRLPVDVRDHYSDIPWRDLAGMGDVTAHGCDPVDLRMVWQAVKQAIPSIQPRIKKILIEARDVG